jgi:hypothetical protein
MFASSMTDFKSRAQILTLIKAAVRHSSVTIDLCRRLNLLAWLSYAIQHTSVSRWELGYLSEIFSLIVIHLQAVN